MVNISNSSIIFDNNLISSNINIYGIYLSGFNLNSEVNIDNNTFNSQTLGIKFVRGILLNGGNVGSNTQLTIRDNSFFIFNDFVFENPGIEINGNFNSSSQIDIFNNDFQLDTPMGGQQTGIFATNGAKNNVSIIANDFIRVYGNDRPGSGIRIVGSTGNNNEISSNNFPIDNILNIPEGDDIAATGISVMNFQNTKYCSNTIGDCAVAFQFSGTNSGTDLEANIMPGGSSRTLSVDGIIGPQMHKGNIWFREFSNVGPTNFAFLQNGNPGIQQITVHTLQTNPGVNTPSYFPIQISPTNGWFVTDPSGSPASGCVSQFTSESIASPRSTPIENSLHKAIVDGSIQDLEDNPTTIWKLEEYLYNQLKRNQVLASKSEDYTFFVTEKQRINVGAFFNVSEGIENAFKADIVTLQLSDKYIERFKVILKELRNIDTQIGEQELGEEALKKLVLLKENLIIELDELEINLSKLEKEYKAKVAEKLSTYSALNSRIFSNAIYEENEQRLNEIYLKSFTEQDRAFTKEQLEVIREIAAQCPKYGGMPVYEARGMLPIEEQNQYDDNREDCYPIEDLSKMQEQPMGQLLKVDSKLHSKVSIYPNPTNQNITVDLGNKENGRIIISNSLGREIINQPLSQKSTLIQLDDTFNTGIYNCTIYFEDGTTKNKKLLINK